MFKAILTAAALALTTLSAQAAILPDAAPSITGPATQHEEVAYFCEWVTVYDFYGNWVTVWQCY